MKTSKDNQKYYLPHGSLSEGDFTLALTPEKAGWAWSGLKILAAQPGKTYTLQSGDSEIVLLSLSGAAELVVAGESYALQGRESIWADVSDYIYIPRNCQFEITAPRGGRFALATAKSTQDLPPRYCPKSEVISMIRGSGAMTRQVNNYSIGNELSVDHVLVTEVYTPEGGWSSYPPHKHEQDTAQERALEEIYYYEMRPLSAAQAETSPSVAAANPAGKADLDTDTADAGVMAAAPDLSTSRGLAFQRIYPSPDFDIDVCVEVHHGDAVIMPYGYHGPTMCAPGYDLYYLNVMAGPAAGAEWKVTFDPEHSWVNPAYEATQRQANPRLPFYPLN